MAYFNHFKVIKYGNNVVRDITQRVDIREKVFENPFSFYPYELQDYQRADMIANRYYNDPQTSWIVYHSNHMVDPYEWHMSYEKFIDYIYDRYGSVEAAQRKILFFRLNWYDDPSEISVSYYNENIDEELKKYWNPVYDAIGNVIAYTRKEDDWVVNTNRIIKCSFANAAFTTGENVYFYANTSSPTVIGSGEVVMSNSTITFVQHIQANAEFAVDNLVVGQDSNANGELTEAPNIVAQNISNAEAVYWSPVYAYDYEEEKNERNRSIQLLDRNLLLATQEQFKDLLKNDE